MPDMMVAVYVLLSLVVLRWVFLFIGAFVLIPRVRDCPACFESTVRIRRPWLRRLLPWIEWRWCAACGWKGPSSRVDSGLVAPPRRR